MDVGKTTQLTELFQDNIRAFHEVGSRYILGDWNCPEYSDYDYLIFVTNQFDAAERCIKKLWKLDGAYYMLDKDFISLRDGSTNLILTDKQEFYERFITAANLCKRLFESGLPMNKATRITIHDQIISHSFHLHGEKEHGVS